MPVLVDPRTGDQYDASHPPAGFDPSEYGLVTPEEYAKRKAGEEEGALGTAARNFAAPLLAAGGQLERLDPSVSAEQHAANEASLQPFFDATKYASQAHPAAALAGQAVPYGILGAATGGIGEAAAAAAGVSPLLGAGAGLAAESAGMGLSQEAVDAVTDNRDFSVKAAGMKGLTNMALGAVMMGGGRIVGGLLGREGAEAIGGAARPGGEGTPGARNFLNELDPGEVPEATGTRAGGGRAMSGGAAAADFDALPEAKAIDEIKNGNGVDAGKIAGAAPAIREQLSVEAARSADAVDKFIYDDAGLGVKHSDFEPGAADWSPELIEKQNKWVDGVRAEAKAAAADLAQTEHAGGLGKAGSAEIEKGLSRLSDVDFTPSGAEGAPDATLRGSAGRNVALDNMKRGIDGLVGRLGNAANSAVDQETRSALMQKLLGVSNRLREGLVDPELFGRNAEIQAAHNEPITELIKPLGRIQKKLYEVTGRTFGETGVGAIERRADPDAFRKLFEDPHLGGKLFKADLAQSLDLAETLARNRQEVGLSHTEGLPQLIKELQAIRDDMNTAQVLHVAEAKAGTAAHGTAGASTGAALGANAAVHLAEYGGRAVGFPLGQVVRSSGAMGKIARGIDRAREAFGFGNEMAERGTATRQILDRYAARVKGSELLEDPTHRALMPEGLSKFLDEAHRPAAPPVMPGGGPGGGQTGTPPAAAPGAPGSPANDVAGKVAGIAALGGGAALLAPGTASAATLDGAPPPPAVGPDGQTLLPKQAAARQALTASLQGLTPDEQAASTRTAEALARIGKSVEQRTQAAVSDLFTVAKNPDAPPRYQSAAAREVSTRAQDLGVPRAVARFMGKNVDDPAQAWREKSQLLSRVVNDPTQLANAMASNLGDLPRLHPEVFAKMVSQTMQQVEYLHDALPAPSGKTALVPNGYPPPTEDINSFAAKWVGTLHPLDTLDDLAANDLMPEQMDAVQANHPEAYEMFRQNALSSIYQLSQRRGPIPLQALQQIDSALSLNGAGEPALSGEMAALIQQATASQAQQQKPPAPPSPMQSQAPSRIASSSLGSLHDDQGH